MMLVACPAGERTLGQHVPGISSWPSATVSTSGGQQEVRQVRQALGQMESDAQGLLLDQWVEAVSHVIHQRQDAPPVPPQHGL